MNNIKYNKLDNNKTITLDDLKTLKTRIAHQLKLLNSSIQNINNSIPKLQKEKEICQYNSELEIQTIRKIHKLFLVITGLMLILNIGEIILVPHFTTIITNIIPITFIGAAMYYSKNIINYTIVNEKKENKLNELDNEIKKQEKRRDKQKKSKKILETLDQKTEQVIINLKKSQAPNIITNLPNEQNIVLTKNRNK